MLCRDEVGAAHPRRKSAVEIGVHEMRVHDVGIEAAREPREQQRVDVARRGKPHRGNLERSVEVGRIPRRIVEADIQALRDTLRLVDPALLERVTECLLAASQVHLIGFAGDLYGADLAVDFVRRLRDTRPFGSAAELVEQLRRDVEQARRL